MASSDASPTPITRSAGGGRKRAFDADEVLGRAVDVFWEHGFGQTTIRQLETELGLTASSIYNTYGSKDGLLDAAIGQYLSLMDRMVLAELRNADDPLAGLCEFFYRISIGVDGEHRWGCFVVSLLTENAGQDERIRAHTDKYFDTLRNDFIAALRRASTQGLLSTEVTGKDLESWIDQQADLLLANVLGINTAARGQMDHGVVDSMTAALQMQIQQWRS